MIGTLLTAGTDNNVISGGSMPYQQLAGNSNVVVVHSKTKNSDAERDTESITLDQFLDECNKSPKSRVCSLFTHIAYLLSDYNTCTALRFFMVAGLLFGLP